PFMRESGLRTSPKHAAAGLGQLISHPAGARGPLLGCPTWIVGTRLGSGQPAALSDLGDGCLTSPPVTRPEESLGGTRLGLYQRSNPSPGRLSGLLKSKSISRPSSRFPLPPTGGPSCCVCAIPLRGIATIKAARARARQIRMALSRFPKRFVAQFLVIVKKRL